MIEDYWKSEKSEKSEVDYFKNKKINEVDATNTSFNIPKPIGDMTDEEILSEFRKAIEENLVVTKDFIILWVTLTGSCQLIKEEYPEYFL